MRRLKKEDHIINNTLADGIYEAIDSACGDVNSRIERVIQIIRECKIIDEVEKVLKKNHININVKNYIGLK